MTKAEREQAFSDADAHLSLAKSALNDLVREGSAINGRDTVLAHGVRSAIDTQRGRIARRLKLGRHL